MDHIFDVSKSGNTCEPCGCRGCDGYCDNTGCSNSCNNSCWGSCDGECYQQAK